MKKDLRIIYMGTPDFAVPSFTILIENGYNIVAVITAPDKPAGRGLKLRQSPVKDAALEADIPVLQPTNLKSSEFLEELKSYKADLQIVVAFRMLPEIVWNMPPIGTFNLHASLLPKYRGAAPINWAIINGEKETGVTTFFLRHAIDTGDIIDQIKEPILEDDTAGTLYERLMHKGAGLVLKTVNDIQQGNVQTHPQAFREADPHAPKIFRHDCEINWNQKVKTVYNHIRGMAPYPAAWTTLQGKTLKIFKAKVLNEQTGQSGSFSSDGKSYLHIATQNGAIDVLELQLEGKKRMSIEDFLKGNKV